MTKDDIIKLAREAAHTYMCSRENPASSSFTFDEDGLKRFANLVAAHAMAQPCCGNFATCQQVCMPRAAAAEREACAKLVVGLFDPEDAVAEFIADAIRARGTT